jgi:hypothetical protein
MTELHRDAWFRLEREDEGGYLVLTRTSVAFGSLTDIGASTARVVEAIRRSGLDRLLFDVSGAGQGRHDPGFEQAGDAFRHELAVTCRRLAVVVKTMAAKLQVMRLSKGLEPAPVVFHDARAARQFLTNDAA